MADPKKMRDGGRVSDRDKMKMEKMARPKKTGGESGKVISDLGKIGSTHRIYLQAG